MNHFKISTPGRIVLSGEHSAIYRKHFVATSLSPRTNLEFWELADISQIIQIDLPEINLAYAIPLENVQCFLSKEEDIHYNAVNIIRYVKYLITLNGMWIRLRERCSLKIFLFLLYIVAIHDKLTIKSFRVHVSTDLPIGSGLGSSTSFTVCLAACFLHWKRLQNGNQSIELNDQFLKNIKKRVVFCEEFLQDYECAWIDIDVCLYGNVVKSQLTGYGYTNIYTESQNMKEMKILLVDSKIRLKKPHQAKQMAKLKRESNQDSNEFDTILNQLDNIAIEIYAGLNSLSNNIEHPNLPEREQHYNSLRDSIRRNQQLLQHNNLSNREFDKICTIATNDGFVGKLTGFGAKYAYILFSPDVTEKQIKKIKRQLTKENFTFVDASINCGGLRIDN